MEPTSSNGYLQCYEPSWDRIGLRRSFPDPSGQIISAAEEPTTVGAEAGVNGARRVPQTLGDWLTGDRIQYPSGAIATGSGDAPAIRAESQHLDALSALHALTQELAGPRIPPPSSP